MNFPASASCLTLALFLPMLGFAANNSPHDGALTVRIGPDCKTALSRPLKLVPWTGEGNRFGTGNGWALQYRDENIPPNEKRLGEIFWYLMGDRQLHISGYNANIPGEHLGTIMLREVINHEQGNFDMISAELTDTNFSYVMKHLEEDEAKAIQQTPFYKALKSLGYGRLVAHYRMPGRYIPCYYVELVRDEI
jgi:hypothetical protein